MKKIISLTFLATLGLLILFTACRKDADNDLVPKTTQEEIQEEVTEEKNVLEPVILDDSNWIELAPNVYVTPDYYETELGKDPSRYYGNCNACQGGCSCPSGWNCNDGDCISTPIDNATIDWIAGGSTVNRVQYPFMHIRHARCWKSWGVCRTDKDNRFYYSYQSWMGSSPYHNLRVLYSGSKSWWCSDGPRVDRLSVNGFQYIRLTTGQYCPTNNVRLVRI